MKIKRKLLEDFIAEVYFQEKDNILKEIKLEESKQELLSFAKKELNESKIRDIINSRILVEWPFSGKKKKDDDEEEDEENDIFGQEMKSSASGGNIKIMTAYGDADHPDHDMAVKMVQKAKEKDPNLKVPAPGHAGSGSSGETGDKSKADDPDTGTVFKSKDDKETYKGIGGDDTEDPKNRPGYIYGDDEIKLPSFARDLPLYWKLKQAAGEEEEVMASSPVKTFVYKSKKKKKGPRISPGGFR